MALFNASVRSEHTEKAPGRAVILSLSACPARRGKIVPARLMSNE